MAYSWNFLQHPGTTTVTDSVTSDGLTTFIEKKLGNNENWGGVLFISYYEVVINFLFLLGGKHHRFKRGYKNVIDEAIRLVRLMLNSSYFYSRWVLRGLIEKWGDYRHLIEKKKGGFSTLLETFSTSFLNILLVRPAMKFLDIELNTFLPCYNFIIAILIGAYNLYDLDI